MVTKYDGDYSRMYKELGALKRDITRTMGAGGEGNAIETNFKNYYNWLKEEQDRLKKGEILQAQLQHGANYYLQNYKGVGQQDPATGNYNLFQPESLAKYTNPDDFLHEALKNVAADEGGSLVSRPDGFYIKTSGGKYEKIDQERIQNIATQTLMNNPEYVNMMHQLGYHMGVDPAQMIQQDIAERAVRMGNIYRKDNRWYESDLKGNPIAVKMWEMQQMERMNNAPGLTMPGNIENTKLNSVRIDASNFGVVGTSGYPAINQGGTGYGKIPSELIGQKGGGKTVEGLISHYTSTIGTKTPALKDAWDATVKSVQASSEYGSATDKEKQKMIARAWNSKLENVETASVNDIVISAQQIPDVKRLWESGMAKAAHYRKVNKDGSLGEVQKFEDLARNGEKQKELLSTPPIVLTPHSEVSGAKIYFGDDEYIVTNTHLDDFADTYLSPISELRKPFFDGKAGEIPYVGMPLSSGTGVTPKGSKLRVTFNDKLERIGNIIGPDGRIIETLPSMYVNEIEGMYTKSASAELPRSSRYSSDYIDYADTKNRYD